MTSRYQLGLVVAVVLLAVTSACDLSLAPPAPTPILPTPTPPTTSPVPSPQPVTSTVAPSPTSFPAQSPTLAPSPTALPPSPTAVPTETEVPAEPSATPTQTAKPLPTRRDPTRTPTPKPPTEVVTAAAEPPTVTPAEATPPGLADTYVFPVQPPDVTSYGRYHHDYPATDIFCPIGSRFVAPTSGVVDYVSYTDRWDPKVDDPATRGGLSVAIIGDDGVRYYGSHLSAVASGIAPGVHVQAGQLLGRTGKTGDARFVQAHLHFGISHPTTPDDWKTRRGEISPYPYLQAWQKGIQLKPALP